MSRLVEIKGYDGDYFISDCGDVFSFKSGKSKILKKRINQGGYYYVNLCKESINHFVFIDWSVFTLLINMMKI